MSLPVAFDIEEVAPLVGAWIEIYTQSNKYTLPRSLPSWERGLKFTKEEAEEKLKESLPSWERGLKYILVLSK